MRRHYLAIEQFQAWAKFNGVEFNNARIERIPTPDGQHKGAGVFITEDFETIHDHESASILLSVPHDLVLSKDLVHDYAKSDVHLRGVLEAVGKFGQVGEMYALSRAFPLLLYTVLADICRAQEAPS